jgi:hypothetical protein
MEGAGILTRGLLSERLANVSVGSNSEVNSLSLRLPLFPQQRKWRLAAEATRRWSVEHKPRLTTSR